MIGARDDAFRRLQRLTQSIDAWLRSRLHQGTARGRASRLLQPGAQATADEVQPSSPNGAACGRAGGRRRPTLASR